MRSIQIIKGKALKRWFEEEKDIKSIKAQGDRLEEYEINSEDIDEDKYYHFYETWSNYVVIEEAVVVKSAWDVDTNAR